MAVFILTYVDILRIRQIGSAKDRGISAAILARSGNSVEISFSIFFHSSVMSTPKPTAIFLYKRDLKQYNISDNQRQ